MDAFVPWGNKNRGGPSLPRRLMSKSISLWDTWEKLPLPCPTLCPDYQLTSGCDLISLIITSRKC